VSRPYRLGRREEIAQETRDRILGAAAELLAETGFRGVTMQRVAQAADVSRVTVYDHFRDKAGLREALAWWTFARLDIDRVRRARLQPDVRAALRDFVRENVRFFDAAGEQGRAILKAASIDPDTAAVVETTYFAARRGSIAELVKRLADEGQLSAAWPTDRAIDALMVITSLEAFETLTEHGSLSIKGAADVLADMTDVLLHNE
jgi:TetR/AcrR family transcriptional regulator of autoinduction and epiphytic fitness